MKSGSSQTRGSKIGRKGPAGSRKKELAHRGAGSQALARRKKIVEPQASPVRVEAAEQRPLAELLACPPETGSLLNGSAQCIDFEAGDTVFRHNEACRGLYIVVSGHFLRRTERLDMRITLGPARAGDLVELAAVLGDGKHTYTLSAQTPGSVLFLPMESLSLAFQAYPPLRMQLLEELAREVSRAYYACWMNRAVRARRGTSSAAVS